ncbi:ATP-binding protein [Actinokineospora sp. G85]|uniref:ATP-binding protein n=1 Tax=Actinokineospora sp. G85 TaxID=3406626 RepID=UPI003C71A9E6
MREADRSRSVARGPGEPRPASEAHPVTEVVLTVEQPDIPPAAELRRTLTERLADLGHGTLDVLHLVCGEFLANAREHGGGLRGLRVWRTSTASVLLVEVDDHNPGDPVVKPKDVEAVTGRGMFLVQTLALAWGAIPHAGGKTVWALVPCEPV